jgi:hypothetical protein
MRFRMKRELSSPRVRVEARRLLLYLGLLVGGGTALGLLLSGMPRGHYARGWPVVVWYRPHAEVPFWGAERHWALGYDWDLVARNRYWEISAIVRLRALAVNAALGAGAGLLAYLLTRPFMRGRRVGHCTKCGYDLTGNVSGRCPECGSAVDGGQPPSDDQ